MTCKHTTAPAPVRSRTLLLSASKPMEGQSAVYWLGLNTTITPPMTKITIYA